MKAKEYVSMVESGELGKVEMFLEFIKECSAIAKQRNPRTTRGVLNMVDEFDKKWKAIANKLCLNKNAHMDYMCEKIPSLKMLKQLQGINGKMDS